MIPTRFKAQAVRVAEQELRNKLRQEGTDWTSSLSAAHGISVSPSGSRASVGRVALGRRRFSEGNQ